MSWSLRISGVGVSLFAMSASLAAQTLAAKAAPQAASATKPSSCSQTAKTQMDLSACADRELKQAEARLAALLKRLGVDPNSSEEKAWEAYRDAQLKALYPPVANAQAEYGSVYPMCLTMLKRKLTESRIRDLKTLTTSDGDACLGYRSSGTLK
jgi:uncharacterized protein YecT (DUF1311 family)